MNLRIKDLAEQARHWAHFEGLEQNPRSSPDILFEQKFSELIVRECLDLLWNSLSISADHVGTVDGIEYTGKEILTAAKEHFFWS